MEDVKGTLFSATKLADLRRLSVEQGVDVDRRILIDIERRVDEHTFRKQLNTIMGLAVVCVCVYVYLKIVSIAKQYPKAYEWWNSQQVFAPGKGHYVQLTLPQAALRIEFPFFYQLQVLAMQAQSVSLAGAHFLVIMATNFAKYMHPVHWNGSAEQLRYDSLDQFLPPHAKKSNGVDWPYVWAAWEAKNAKNQPVNPWGNGVLFTNVRALANSPAFQAYYADPPDRRYIDALFHGGLTEIAVMLGNSDATGPAMAEHLMGVDSGFTKVECTGRVSEAVKTSMDYGMKTGMIGGVVGHLGAHSMSHMFARMPSGWKAVLRKPSRLSAVLLTVAMATALGVGAAAGAAKCNESKTSYSGLGRGSGGQAQNDMQKRAAVR